MKIDIVFEKPVGLGHDAIEALRPQLESFVTAKARDLVYRIQGRLSRQGRSAPGQAPGKESGDYQRSFESDTRSLKKSVQGRIGSTLWQRFGRALESGNAHIRPRPHVRPSFEQWARAVKTDIESNNNG